MVTPKEYNQIYKHFKFKGKNSDFCQDITHDYLVKVLEGVKVSYIWQFNSRYMPRYQKHIGNCKFTPEIPTNEQDNSIILKEIAQVAKKMHKNTQNVLDLYLQGYDTTEIGEKLGHSRQNAHKHLQQLIKKCQKHFGVSNG